MISNSARTPVVDADNTENPDTLPGLLHGWAAEQAGQTAITVLDFKHDPDGTSTELTWWQLDRRVRAVSAELRARTPRGERAAILIEQNAEYVIAFLAALHAGLVAVPLFFPERPGQANQVTSVIADAAPRVVLTTGNRLNQVRGLLSGTTPRVERFVAVDQVPDGTPEPEDPVELRSADLAYLQYTSGSTRSPVGVMITHGNVVASARQAAAAYGARSGRTVSVSWLPLYHDMGLVLAIAAPILVGTRTVLMDPAAFLQRPARWLRALSDNPGAISAAPSFAYGLCAERVPAWEKASLRLDRVTALIDGSEPVQPGTIVRFHSAFWECGLKPSVYRSSYGLAEATVLVSATGSGKPPRQTSFDRAELAAGRAVRADGDAATTLVSSGRPVGQRVCVVDPRTHLAMPHGQVGEIWVTGPNVGRGYWQRFDESADTFCALLAEQGDAEPQWWLRTGDLGFVFDGELYVNGRIKDLIIVNGRNHYPPDVEQTVEQAHPVIRARSVAAFAVPAEDGERAVVVAERSSWADDHEFDHDEVTSAVRATVSGEHGLTLADVLIVPPGGIPRTSSRKIARSQCRDRYLSGAFVHSGLR